LKPLSDRAATAAALTSEAPSSLVLTLGDVAGIGPEVLVKAWARSDLTTWARVVVVGNATVIRRAVERFLSPSERFAVEVVEDLRDDRPARASGPGREVLRCWEPLGVPDTSKVAPATIDPRAGKAAHDWLVAAIDATGAGLFEGIVTLPLHKEALRAGGIEAPGHTEILTRRCGLADDHTAMMLYLPPGNRPPKQGLGVIHVTLHCALREVFDQITIPNVERKIALAANGLEPLLGRDHPTGRVRLAVAGLNPHAGENGLFGSEESVILTPAVASARSRGLDVVGPIAADTLFARAVDGEFDGVVAMYHDQGHVVLKTLGFDRAVNVTLGLPIVRTSVAHGTAFDRAWPASGPGSARFESLLAAVRVADLLARSRRAAEAAT